MMRRPCAYCARPGVVPILRHEEDVDIRLARPDRLLLDAADPADAAVELDLAGGSDLVAVVDVPSELLEQLEREREACGRPADVAEVEPDREREADVESLRGQDSDRGRFGSDASLVVLTEIVSSFAPRRTPSVTTSPGTCFASTTRRSPLVRSFFPSAETITSPGFSSRPACESEVTATIFTPPAWTGSCSRAAGARPPRPPAARSSCRTRRASRAAAARCRARGTGRRERGPSPFGRTSGRSDSSREARLTRTST